MAWDSSYSVNGVQFRAVYDEATRSFSPYVKIDGGTFTLALNDLEIGAIEIKDGVTDDRVHVTPGGLLAVDASGAVVPISATALPLPSGAATSANQTSIISAIGNTNTAIGNLAKLTDTQPVSISQVVVVSGPLTDAQLRATPVPISGPISFTAPQHVIVDSAPTTAVTIASLPSLAAGSAVIGHVIVDSGFSTVSGSVAVSNFPALQPISAAALPLPTGASTEATLATLATQATLAAIKARTDNIPALGQAASDSSLPIVIASDQNTNVDRQSRRIQEMQLIEAADMGSFAFAKRASERIFTTDRRGSIGRGATR